MVYDDAQFLGRLASWDASESSLLLRTDGVSKCIHQGHQDSLPIATWQRKAYPSNWMILNDSILLSSHWVRLRFSNGYQSHQEELVQYGIFFLVCNLKSGNSSSEERPNQLTWGLALPFRIHSPQFQASKECAEVQGSTESAVAERRARLDWPVKSSSVACFFCVSSLPPMRCTVDSRVAESCLQSFFWGWEYLRWVQGFQNFRDSPDKAMAKVCLLQRTLFKSRLEGALGGRLRPCQWAHILQLSSTASGQDSGQTTKVLLMLVVSFCPCAALRVWPVLSLLCRKRDAENVAAHLSQGISELSEFVICSWILGVCL